MVNEFHQRINYSGEPEFDSWLEQILSNLYLLPNQTLDYHDPFTMRTGGLTQKNKWDISLWLILFKMCCINDRIDIFDEIWHNLK